MAVVFSNNAKTTLASNVSASATSISVVDGSAFPALSGSDYAYVTFEDVAGNVEIVKLTALSGNTLTVVRAQDNTSARAFSTADKCELRLTAAGLNEVASQADTDTNTTYSIGDGGLTTNDFTNADHSKLNAIEASATADQTNAEIRTAVEAATDSNVFTDADHTKLGGIATNANNYVLPSSIATQSYVGTQISNLVDSSPATLNTLNELAAALGDDPNFATTVSASIGTKLPLAGGTMTGTLAMGANSITSTGTISSGAITSSGAIQGTYFSDGYIAWSAAQINRYGAAIELQFTPTNAATLVKIGANGSNPTIFNAYTGAAIFNGNLTVNGADVTITGNVIHAGDTDTYFGFHDADSWRVVTAGTERLEVSNSGVIINDSGADIDFRVESNSNTHMLFVDGGNNRLGINTSSPSFDVDIQSNNPQVNIEATTDNWAALRITAGATQANYMFFFDDTAERARISVLNSEDMTFSTASTPVERLSLSAAEAVFNDTGVDTDFRVESNGNANMLFVDGGNNKVGIGVGDPADVLEVSGGSAYPHIRITSPGNTSRYLRLGMEDAINHVVEASGAGTNLLFKTAGSTRLTIGSTGNVNFSGDITGVTDLYIADQIVHSGDTNTYMQFHQADGWRVVTGGVERIRVESDTSTHVYPALTSATQKNELVLESRATGSTAQTGALTGITFNNRTNLYVAGSFNSTAGVYGVDLDTGQYGRSLGLDFYTSATDSTATRKLRIDAAGAATFSGTISSGAITSTGASTFGSVTGSVLVSNIVDPGNPVAAADNLRLSGYGVMGNRGSMYLTNSNASGLIVMGISGAHNANPKLTVSTGGISVNGNVTVSGTVDGVDIAARNGVLTSTTTTAGAALPRAGGTLTGNLTAPTLYLNNTDTRLHEGSGNSLRITTSTGYIDIGSQNSGWIHFQGNRPYYFNQPLNMDANLQPYNTSGARNLGGTSNVWNHVYAKGYFIDSAEVIDASRNIRIPLTSKLYFGGGNHTYISEDIDDRLRFFAGGAEFMRFTESSTNTVSIYQDISHAGNFTTDGYVQHAGVLYSRNTLNVLNTAGNGWSSWATRGNDTFNLSVGTISSGAITSTGSSQLQALTVKGGTGTTTESILTFENYADTAHIKSRYTNPSSTTETYLAFYTNKSGESNGTVSESMRLSGNNLSVNGTVAATGGNSTNWNTAYTVANAALPKAGGTMTGALTINNTADNQILLTSPSSWTGIGWNDSATMGTDYIWHNGTHGTFAIGGNGSNVANKKLHVDGGMTIGSSYDSTAVSANSLNVQGTVTATGGNSGNWNTAYGWGNHASAGYTNDQTAAEILTAIKTVDGSGSGLDADLLDGIQGASFLRSDADDSFSGGLVSTARDEGIFGTYDPAKTDHIWSMGVGYKSHASGTNFGNLYGLAYKHTNNTTGGTMGGGHQIVWADNGTPRAAIGYDRFWHAASGNLWGSSNDGSGSGLDADLLDGLHATSFASSTFNVESGASNSDPNSRTDAYFLTNSANAAFGSVYSHIQNHWWSNVGGNVAQHATTYNGSTARFAVRHRYSGSWTSWAQAWTQVNDGSGSGLDADLLDGYNAEETAVNNSIVKRDGSAMITAKKLFLNGGNYEGSIVFGAVDAWRTGIRQHDDNDAEMRIWAKNASGRIYIATGYDGQPASIARPTDGLVVDGNSVGIGDFSGNGAMGYKLHVKGTILGTSAIKTDDAFMSDRWEDNGGTFLFKKGSGSGRTRHLNLADATSDPASVTDAQNPTGISWGQRSDNTPYYMLGLKGSYNNGYSTHSRLTLAWHTGIEIGASATYGGTRFMADSPFFNTTEIMSVGKGDGHVRVTNNLYANGGNLVFNVTNDGSGSGLDADLLDGQHGSYYQPANTTIFRSRGSVSVGSSSYPFDDAHTATKVVEYGTRVISYTGASATMLTINTGGSAAVFQIGAHYNGNEFYMRTRTDSSTWRTWKKLWHAGNDASGSGLDADLLDGQEGAYYYAASNPSGYTSNVGDITGVIGGTGLTGGGYSGTPTLNVIGGSGITANANDIAVDSTVIRTTGNQSMSGVKTFTTSLTTPLVTMTGSQSRTKLRVWSGNAYGMGMQSGYTFGGLGDYAMTFQMNNTSARGFWWGDDGHTNAQGAMSLTTNGKLSVASGIRVGYGETDTTSPAAGLTVSGNIVVTGTVDGRDIAADGTKLNTIETGATADQTAAQIQSLLGIDIYNNLTTSTGSGSNLNTIFANNQSGFIDSWSGANLPSGTSHVQGIQARHMSGAEYGFQFVNQYNQDKIWHRRVTNGSYAAWQQVWTANSDGSGSGLDADLLDGNHASAFCGTGGFTMSGLMVGRIAGSSTVAANNDGGSMSIRGDTTKPAVVSFHRAGAYAINFGLSTANKMEMGGWSASSIKHTWDFAGNYTAVGNITAYSDIRVKENIEVIPEALDKVCQLSGYTFDRTDFVPDAETGVMPETRQTGVIAQEVLKVLPEAVAEMDDGKLTVAYGNMVGLLIESIKELKAEIDTLKTQIGE